MTTRVGVNVGDEVFAKGKSEAFGAVRVVRAHELIIDIENFGDAAVPAAAVIEIHDRKIVLDPAALPDDLRQAIAHAHDREER